ncbi:hypothetical protein TIFTF001_007399 [Ficus carica]|uniref:Uncharacterized protein n=1 Tax=Ficus carica TaxID=3494 RepID=A0AA88D1Z8_FICCA|nr:hypothetical protein TIFTF001_007399 [Ficus carica]
MSRPSRNGLGCGQGSVAQASTLEPKRQSTLGSQRRTNLGINSPTEVLVGQPGDLKRNSFYNLDLTSLVWSGFIE